MKLLGGFFLVTAYVPEDMPMQNKKQIMLYFSFITMLTNFDG